MKFIIVMIMTIILTILMIIMMIVILIIIMKMRSPGLPARSSGCCSHNFHSEQLYKYEFQLGQKYEMSETNKSFDTIIKGFEIFKKNLKNEEHTLTKGFDQI